MGALISEVREGSIAEELGIQAGDWLVRINQRKVLDILDYQFYSQDDAIEIEIKKLNGDVEIIEIEKDAGEDLGLGFDQVLFNKMKKCANKCEFCFIDQLPPGMRESLYFKDDDYRLSFLYGNFISLTNLTAADREKIYEMRLSPLYVSVHSTDRHIRARIMGSAKAADIIDEIQAFREHGIAMHAQIVLCPGINDGESLYSSVECLAQFYPTVLSVGIVPVGITGYSHCPERIRPVDSQEAEEIIQRVEDLQAGYRKSLGSGFVYLADEFFIKAGQPFPEDDYYDDYCQLENGIGFCRCLLDEFAELADTLPARIAPREVAIITGISSAGVLQTLAQGLENVEGLTVEVIPVVNHFFGEQITVTGLLTGSDIIKSLGQDYHGRIVLVPEVLLKDGTTVFLDDVTVEELAAASGAQIILVDGSASDLIDKALGRIKPIPAEA